MTESDALRLTLLAAWFGPFFAGAVFNVPVREVVNCSIGLSIVGIIGWVLGALFAQAIRGEKKL